MSPTVLSFVAVGWLMLQMKMDSAAAIFGVGPRSCRPANHPHVSTHHLAISTRGGDIQTITSLSQIKAIVDEASQQNTLVVLDFASHDCPPCEMIAPIYSELSDLEEFADVAFCKVNVSDHPEIAERYDVDGWPTFLLFKGGEEAVDSIVGGQAAKAGLYGLVAKYNT